MATTKTKTKTRESADEKLIVRNRRASYDYELGERFEAGLVLIGSEVKVLRAGSADLSDAWCAIERGEAFLKGMNVPELTGALFGHEAKRPRKLLLHVREIETIQRALERDGMTVVATRLYFKHGRVKVELAVARGKERRDKRRDVQEREAKRQIERALKSRR